ncbi:MAG: NAD(+)/NADH kinase, partial [Anaerolineaceae bacterium]|nr:NAD(+)/NADH kinase [Anaerolineaceae bacterium]
MSQTHQPPQKIAVLANPVIEDALHFAENVAGFLNAEGAQAVAGSLNDADLRQAVQAREVDALIALGGDGTMLRAGHLCAPAGIPLLGINVGHFGFLVEVKREGWRETLPKLLSGEFRYEERMMILARCSRKDCEEATFDVINDVVV